MSHEFSDFSPPLNSYSAMLNTLRSAHRNTTPGIHSFKRFLSHKNKVSAVVVSCIVSTIWLYLQVALSLTVEQNIIRYTQKIYNQMCRTFLFNAKIPHGDNFQ